MSDTNDHIYDSSVSSRTASQSIILDSSSMNVNSQKEDDKTSSSEKEFVARPTQPRILQRFRHESETYLRPIVSAQVDNVATKTSIETQTEWSWLQDLLLIEKIKREGGDILKDIMNEVNYESEESDEESVVSRHSPKPTPTIESIGPPKILQFQPETKKPEIIPPSPTISVESEPIQDLGQFMRDFNIYIQGGNPCEFCNLTTKPWPNISSQEIVNPTELYCCSDYQEFVEGLIEYQREREKIKNENNNYISKFTENNQTKNKKARKLAKERSEYRNMQRLIEKQKRQEHVAAHNEAQAHTQTHATKSMNTINRVSERIAELHSRDSRDQISNQVRSINYQLSNLRYLHEGWTVRPTSPLDNDDINADEVELNLMGSTSAFQIRQRMNERSLLVKRYKNDNICLVVFPDGSGNAFYPSGRVALSISLVSYGMHIMSIFSDEEVNQEQIASFDPYGNASANFPNGKIRMILTPLGGLELDSEGFKRKRWLWWENDNHVHAPPFQPIIFSLNNYISVKVFSQEKINVTFHAENQICKFRVGSKIKVARPEQLQTIFKADPSELYLKKKRSRIEELLRLLADDSNQFKLPRIVNLKDASTPRFKLSNFSHKANNDTKESSKFDKKSSVKTSKFITVP